MKHIRLTLFAFISLLSFFGGFLLFDANTSIRLYTTVAYPATVILFLLVFYSLYRSGSFSLSKLKQLGTSRLLPISVLYCLLGVMFTSQEPYGFKTLADEALIVSTSQNLHLERKPFFIWRAYDIDSNFTPIEQYLDKRPIAFSTLLSFVHDLTGFRVENAYFLNTLLGLGVLAFVGYWGYHILGRLGAAFGMILMAGLPLLSVYSHGGGFDVFHVFMIFVVIGCGIRWYDRSDAWSLVAFVLTGVLLCFTRYEAALFAFPIGVVVIWKWFLDRRIQLPWILLVVPLLMVLIPLHQEVFELNENYWELDFRPEADTIFGFKYFYPNLASAIRFLWDTSEVFPNSPVLSSLGVLSSALLVGVGIPRIRHILLVNPKALIWIVFLGMIVIHFLLMMVYFYGQFDYGPLHRFALPICVFFVICSLWGLKQFETMIVRKLALGIVCVGYFFYSIPVASKHHYSNNNWTSIHSVWVGKYAEAHRDESFMVIGFNPVYWTLEGIPAIPWGQANLNPEKLKFQLEHKGFEKILIVERIVRDEVTGDLGSADKVQLVDGFKKEVVDEFVIDSFFRIRVSRLLDVDVEAVTANVAALTDTEFPKENPREKFRRINPVSLGDKPGMAEFYFNLPLSLMPDKMRKLFLVQKHSSNENIRSMKKMNWVWVLGLGLAFFFISFFWLFHGTRNTDEGFYIFCAQLLSQGSQPYKDFGFTQPPLVLLFNLPFLELFGFSLIGVRLASMAAVLLGVILCSIFLFTKEDPKAAFIYIFLNLTAIGWLVVSMKGRNYALAGTFVLFSTTVQYLGKPPVLQWMLFSFFSALAVATRYPSFWFLVPLAFVYLSDVPNWRKRLFCVFGSALWGVVVVWFISFGDLQSFWFWTVDYHLASTINVKKQLEFFQFLSLAPAGFGMLVFGIVLTANRGRFRELTLLLLCLIVFISGFFSRRYYGEYAAIYIPSLLFLLTQVFLPYLRGVELRHLVIGAMVVFTANGYVYQKLSVSSSVSYDVVKRATEAAEFLKDHTSRGDVVMASVLEIPMQANRSLPSCYSMGVFSISNTLNEAELSAYHINTPSELLATFVDENVKALVLSPNPRGNFRWSIPTLEFFPEHFYEKFGEILEEYWELAYLNDDYVVLLPKTQFQ